ncbi:hypothetical protein KAT45_01285 [Candidatus Aerophobetes bacterium]|nr:hypothetical protein [Candidatus Aerophobetes bacterium]
MMTTKEITERILKELPSLLPALKVGKIEVEKRILDQVFDLAFKTKTKDRQEWLLLCEIKGLLQPRIAREISTRFKERIANSNRVYPVLITTFIGERTREILKKEGVGYLDLAGNCFLEFNTVYIEKIVDKNPFVDKRKLKTIFKPVSSRILRVLLEESKKGWKILELSRIAKVSLGQTSNVCRWLIDEEYIKKDQGMYYLTEPGRLLDEWCRNYIYTQNRMFTCYSFERNRGKLIKRVVRISEDKELEYALTLLSGASLIAPFIRGISSLQMYVTDSKNLSKWVSLLDLRPAESGSNISMYVPYDEGVFDKTQEIDDIRIVGNIQLYLDLYNYPARGREQAEFLRREKIKF